MGAIALLNCILALTSCSRLTTADEAHTGKAKVTRKDFVHFSSSQRTYINDYGESIPIDQWRQRDGEKRLYLVIFQYDETSEEARSECATLEERRARQFGPLYEIVDDKLFDEVHVGDTLSLRYTWDGEGPPRLVSVNAP
jgi:hypothetical protein